jgi:membrane associated rhomboid family serine protease
VAVPAYVMLVFWAFLQLLGGVPQVAGAGGGGGVAFMAHVGGFVAGAALIRLFTKPELIAAHQSRRQVRFREFGGDRWY